MKLMATKALIVPQGAARPLVTALWERALRLIRRVPKRLRLCENLPLGERRFVAVIEFDAARFLVGGTASSLTLLSRLPDRSHREGKVATEEEKEKEEEGKESGNASGRQGTIADQLRGEAF